MALELVSNSLILLLACLGFHPSGFDVVNPPK